MTRDPLVAHVRCARWLLLLLPLLGGCGESPAVVGNADAAAPDLASIEDASSSLGDLSTGALDLAQAVDGAVAPDGGGSMWRPTPGTSWQWQLSGALDTSFDVAAYDIDLFGTTPVEIAALHAKGRKVICYFDTAYEPGRPDSAQLAPFKGNPVQGWPGQFWLDVRQPAVLAVMKARIALARMKLCDAIEADDVDARTNNPGFPLTANDQQSFIKALAAETHAAGMSFALKNDLDEVVALLPFVDFAVNEECFALNECDLLTPFIKANKAVLQVEYTAGDLKTKGASVCPMANARNFDTLIKHLDLDPPRYGCR